MEAARNQRHLSSQGSEDGKIQFANFGVSNSMNRRQIIEEDPVKVFEVFRMTQPPEEPLSFVGNLHRRVLDKNIIDRVQPDTTYYYMFRSIDNHGNVSNPSPPFEVTLVGGVSPYLIINEFSYTGEEKKLETAKKKIQFWNLPDVLVITLKRFDNRQRKNKVYIDFPLENLNMSKYVIGYDKDSYVYDLYGVCNHSGGTRGGHYTAFIKNANKKWYLFNDTSVTEISDENKIKSTQAYCFFYRKKK